MRRNHLGRGGRSVLWCVVAVGALAVAVAGGVAYATIPDSGGVIHACYVNRAGNLRVIDTETGAACRPDETPLSWPRAGSAGGGPVAFAHIANGELDATRSKDVVSVTTKVGSFDALVYCFVLTATPVNVVVTAEKDAGGFVFPAATVAGTAGMSSSPCDPGTSAAVYYGSQPPPGMGMSPAASFFVSFN